MENLAINTSREEVKQMPKLEYLIMAMEEQCGEIEHLRKILSSTGHRIYDTTQPEKYTDEICKDVHTPDYASRMELILIRMQNIRVSLSELNTKFESLI